MDIPRPSTDGPQDTIQNLLEEVVCSGGQDPAPTT